MYQYNNKYQNTVDKTCNILKMSRIGLLKHGWIHRIELNAQHQDIFQHQILLMLLQVTFPIKSLQIYIYYIG